MSGEESEDEGDNPFARREFRQNDCAPIGYTKCFCLPSSVFNLLSFYDGTSGLRECNNSSFST